MSSFISLAIAAILIMKSMELSAQFVSISKSAERNYFWPTVQAITLIGLFVATMALL